MAEGENTAIGCKSPAKQASELIFGASNLEYQVEQFIKSGGQSVKILLSGKTGVGKSHLTNALIGEELAEEGDDVDPQTDEVTGYEFPKNNVNITVFDTPGLADATGKDEEYLQKIQAKGIEFDLFLFCTEMNAIRFRNDDLETMKKLTITLGRQLWDHAVVVLTFANDVHPSASQKANNVPDKEVFSNRVLGFKKKIKEVLKQLDVPEETAINMPFVPAGDLHEPKLPDRENWLTAFWVAVFKRINRNAKAPFLLANVDRIAFSSLLLDDENEENNEGVQGSQVQGVSREELQAMKEMKRKMQEASFGENLLGCLQKPRLYDECGNKCSTPGDPAAKRYVPPIEMNEASSRDVVKEMVGEDTGSFMSNLISPAFDYVYQTFFGSISLRFGQISEEEEHMKEITRGQKLKEKEH